MHVIRDLKHIREGEGEVKREEVRWGGVGGGREVRGGKEEQGERGRGRGRNVMGLCIQSTCKVINLILRIS